MVLRDKMRKKMVIPVVILSLLLILPATSYEVYIVNNSYRESNAGMLHTNGNTLYVGGSGPNNYSSIQDAIDNASDGDTVFVYSGVYKESIILDKTINLMGEDREKTIISATKGYDINITGRGVSISNFNITNGSWEYPSLIIYKSSDNIIFNCNFYNNSWSGIGTYSSGGNKIFNCTLSDNIMGMEFYHSYNNTISNCNISHNGGGILLQYSDNNSIFRCAISDNKWAGILVEYSQSNDISHNTFVNNGIDIGGKKLSHFIHYIDDNTINGLPLIYYKNGNNITLEDTEVGEVIMVNCSHFEIKNVSTKNSDVGIEIAYCNNGSVSGCMISDAGEGIVMTLSSQNLLSNNTIYSSNESGIYLDSCSNNTISGNDITNTYSDAIFVWNSSYNNISNNEISENGMGITIFSYSDHNTVYGNHVVKNDFYGISIQGGSFNIITHNIVSESKYWCGISTSKSWTRGNVISYNEVTHNNWVGIEIEGVENIICNNNISYNTECGLYLSSFLGTDCKRNVIKENNFIGNGLNSEFDVKFLSLNLWYENYWDDWHSFLPKPIHGRCIIFSAECFRIRVPWIQFDWHPAREPYRWKN